MLKILFKTDSSCTFGEKIVYPTNVPHLHGFCTFSVPHLKIVVPHLKLEQLATLLATDAR